MDITPDKINPERKYVILCFKHKGLFPGCLLFWGNLTEDNEERSFGGYTTGLDRCERYTEEELKNSNHTYIPFYNGYHGESLYDFANVENIFITIDDLLSLPWFKTMQVVYRP